MQKRKTGEQQLSFLALAVRSAAVVVFLFALSHVALAQSNGTVQGTVTDTSNAAVPGATVVVHNQNAGVERTTKTNLQSRKPGAEHRHRTEVRQYRFLGDQKHQDQRAV